MTAPLRAPRRGGAGRGSGRRRPRGRKEAKYREIRDAELDHAQGKLSEEDWRAADAELRAEAIEILRELDEA